MSRLTVFSLCAALSGVAQAATAGDDPAGPSQDAKPVSVAEVVESAVGRVYQSAVPAIVRVESEDELGKVAGTGFFIDADGTIFTLATLVGDGMGITVTHGESKMPARLLTKDDRTGLALIKVESAQEKPFLVKGDSSKVKTATPLVVVGFPYDHEPSPSFGVVGGLDRKSRGKFFATTHIRANIPVQRGQGGSPVLDLDGVVVGVLISGFEEGTGCYVLPIRAAEKVRSEYVRYGKVRHGWAGVTLQEIPTPVEGSRMAIDMIDPTGPAGRGFRAGDVVLQVGDVVIREPEDAFDASFFLTAGEPVNVRISRQGEVLDLPLTPADHPMSPMGLKMHALGPGGLLGNPPLSAP